MQTVFFAALFMFVADALYSAKWVGTTIKMLGLFVWAFGIDISSEAVMNAARKIAAGGADCCKPGEFGRQFVETGFPRFFLQKGQRTVHLCTKAENHRKTLVLLRDGGFLVEDWALDSPASIRPGSESLFQ